MNERKDPENKPSVEMTESNVILLEQINNVPGFSKSKCDNHLKETKKESYT